LKTRWLLELSCNDAVINVVINCCIAENLDHCICMRCHLIDLGGVNKVAGVAAIWHMCLVAAVIINSGSTFI